MSMDNKALPLRILVMGASESNRRKPFSMGDEVNRKWAIELENRNQVKGYWPAFFMHGIDARACGMPFPEQRELSDFGTGRYLYDRRLIYKWRFAELWNLAMSANVARAGLLYLKKQKTIFREFSPDVTIVCLGGVDCLETVSKRVVRDFYESGCIDFDSSRQNDPVTIGFCKTPEEFLSVMKDVAMAVKWISRGGIVLFLDIIGRRQSRSLEKKRQSFNMVIKEVCSAFSFVHVSFPFLTQAADTQNSDWFRPDDGHPTDNLNATLAKHLLSYIPHDLAHINKVQSYPVSAVNVFDWTEEKL